MRLSVQYRALGIVWTFPIIAFVISIEPSYQPGTLEYRSVEHGAWFGVLGIVHKLSAERAHMNT